MAAQGSDTRMERSAVHTSAADQRAHSRADERARSRTEELDDHPGLSTRPVRDADRIDLERAIARLPNGYRAVLVLHDVEGFTHEEIGRQLGIAVGTSKSQLFDARRAIRSLLQSQPEAHHA